MSYQFFLRPTKADLVKMGNCEDSQDGDPECSATAWKENRILKSLLEKKQGKMVSNMEDEREKNAGNNEQSEKNEPFQIFPEELWRIIFYHLWDPKDLENCYKTCMTFQKVLEDKKPYFIFPKIFGLVDSKYPFCTADLLICRLVSPLWKKLADATLQSRKYRYNFNYLNDTEMEYNVSETFRYTFDDPSAIRAYNKGSRYLKNLVDQLNSGFYFEKSNFDWSPIPSRHLIIQDNDIPNFSNSLFEDTEKYRVSTNSLLQIIGHHVWYLDIWTTYRTSCDWYNLLLDWLHYTPNVKVLQFVCHSMFSQHELRLKNLVTSRPFPTLTNLVMLTMKNTPNVVINSALEANKNVQMLQILRISKRSELKLGNHLLNRLQNLNKISLTIYCDQEFEQLESLIWPRIETINMSFGRVGVTWEQIFSVLNRFCESLTTLNLRLPRARKSFFVPNENETEKTEKKMLQLPNLKQLRICVADHTPIDFILPMHSLEDLDVFVDHMEYRNVSRKQSMLIANDQIIKFNQFYESLDESNIWDKLSSLKKMHVAVKDAKGSCFIWKKFSYKRISSGAVVRC